MGTNARIGAVITAAGMSRRMKAFKPLLPLGDTTIIRRCVETYVDAGCSPVIVVTGKNADQIAEHLGDLPVEFVHNPGYETNDMFCSVKLGLSALKERCSSVFISPADIPLIKTETLVKLRLAGEDIVKPVCNGKTGHPLLISAGLITDILSYEEDGGLRGALEYLCAGEGLTVLEIEAGDPGILLDADTPEDYAALLRYVENEKDTQF